MAYFSDSTADTPGGVAPTLASVTRSLEQAGRLREQFDRRWGFVRDPTLYAALEVCVGVGVCVRLCVCVCVCVCVYSDMFRSTSF